MNINKKSAKLILIIFLLSTVFIFLNIKTGNEIYNIIYTLLIAVISFIFYKEFNDKVVRLISLLVVIISIISVLISLYYYFI